VILQLLANLCADVIIKRILGYIKIKKKPARYVVNYKPGLLGTD